MDTAKRDDSFDEPDFFSHLLKMTLGERPEFQQVLDYLKRGNGVPEVQQTRLQPGTHGVFSYDTSIVRDPGLIEVAVPSANTLVHEMTHAAQKQMLEQAHSPDASKQYRDGFNKLLGGEGPAAVMNKLAPEWAAKHQNYRTTPKESQAHAFGNMSELVHPSQAAPSHIDPTLATEFMILLDLATRDQANQTRLRQQRGVRP